MRYIARAFWFLVLLLVLFVFGFGWRDIKAGRLPTTAVAKLLDATFVQNSEQAAQEFSQNYQKIRADYYKSVPADKLTYAGMEGLMASLGDPHTMFMEPQEAQDFSVETDAHFVGVGAQLEPYPEPSGGQGAKVKMIFENGPAEKAGLKDGDLITGVDGKSVLGLSLENIVSKIRGKEGTEVQLTVVRPKELKPVVLTATRAIVETPTVTDTKVLPGTDFGYLQVTSFSMPTAEQFVEQLGKLEKQHIKGLIIDLRDNPGGLLETAQDMLGLFVGNKTVVTVKGRDGEQETVASPAGEEHHFKYPVVVLINEDSASAAEIFSGDLQDYQLATLVGMHSYGKASVQTVTPLVGGSSAKITIAHYFLPSGRDIGRKVDDYGQFVSGGLTPDVKVELNQDVEVTPGDLKTDNQLVKAVEVLKQKTGS